jgi:hypothetical protein
LGSDRIEPECTALPFPLRPLRALVSAAVVLGAALPTTTAARDLGTFTFTLDNDLFGGSDRYYTNGIRLAWRSPAYAPPDWLAAVGRFGAPLLPPDGERRWGLALGQNLYTPEDISREDPDPDDRPYAAWLYGAFNLSSATATSLSRLEVQLGVVGPAALGEQAQNTVHRINRGQEAQGWDAQLANEPGLNVIASRIWRFNRPLGGEDSDWAVGALPSLTASLGNINTHAAAGFTVRFGRGLDVDFGPPRIRPSVSGSSFVRRVHGWGGYVFAGIEGRAVARNIFLDGNTFQDSPSVDKKALVGEASLGVALVFPGGRLSYTHVLRSEEFETQETTSDFGSLSLSLHF